MLSRYFAYGSNMNPDRVRERGLQVRDICGASLWNYRLVFDKVDEGSMGAGHANVIAHLGAKVEGVLYTLDSLDEILKMDRFERTPVNYGREAVRLDVNGQPQWAWTYFANQARRRLQLRPTAEYLAHLTAGAPFLSADYLESLHGIDRWSP